jgi:hypothetical protein
LDFSVSRGNVYYSVCIYDPITDRCRTLQAKTMEELLSIMEEEISIVLL